MILDLRIVRSSPRLYVEISYINKLEKKIMALLDIGLSPL